MPPSAPAAERPTVRIATLPGVFRRRRDALLLAGLVRERGHARDAHFQGPPSFEHLLARAAVERRKDAERVAIDYAPRPAVVLKMLDRMSENEPKSALPAPPAPPPPNGAPNTDWPRSYFLRFSGSPRTS